MIDFFNTYSNILLLFKQSQKRYFEDIKDVHNSEIDYLH